MRLHVLLMLACVGTTLVAKAAQPSTRPASLDDQLVRADAELKSAADQLTKATAKWNRENVAAQRRAQDRPDIIRLSAAVDEARKRLVAISDEERTAHTPNESSAKSERLRDAEDAYLRAIDEHAKAVHQAVASDPLLQHAAKNRARALEGLRHVKRAAMDVRWTWEAKEREIVLAVYEKSLAPGMTEAQAEQAMGGQGLVVARTTDGKTVAWECTAVVKDHFVTTGNYARFADGRVVQVWASPAENN